MNFYLQQGLIVAAVAIGAYFIGNINFAAILAKIRRKDIHKMGSGNPGTMNMIRSMGKLMGGMTLLCDVLKGAIPAILGWLLVGGIGFHGAGYSGLAYGIFFSAGARAGLFVAGFAVVLGHVFPVVRRFKGGGKGIASTIGVAVVAQPIIGAIMMALGILFIVATKMGSLGSFFIISVPLALEGYFTASNALIPLPSLIASLVLISLLLALTIFTHRGNIARLFRGEEKRTVIFKKKKKPENQEQQCETNNE